MNRAAGAGSALRRIVVDARMVGPVGHGIARYVQLIARGLAEIRRADGLPYDLSFVVAPGIRIEDFPVIESSVPFLDPRELVALPIALRRAGADLYHSPSFASLAVAPCPWIVTVHDLIHLEYGAWRERVYYQALLRPFVRRARAVLTVSEHSRAELRRWAGVDSEVVHNVIEPSSLAIPESESISFLTRAGLRAGAYFVALSSTKPHKNLAKLVEAYGLLRSAEPGTWPLALTARIESAPDGVISLGALGEREAQIVLKHAGALVYPSLVEGFGRPPLEAAIEGVPIVVSRIPPHVEALCDLDASEVEWVEPPDLRGWVEGLRRAAAGGIRPASPATRERILTRYSAARVASDMDRVYRRVLGLGA